MTALRALEQSFCRMDNLFIGRGWPSVSAAIHKFKKKLLAIVYRCEKFHQFVYWKDIHIESDQKPQESIFQRLLHRAPLGLQKMLLRLHTRGLKVTDWPGKELNRLHTFLSRPFIKEQKENLREKELELKYQCQRKKLHKLRRATAEDPEMQLLKDITLRGWLNERNVVPKEIRLDWTLRDEISRTSGLMFKVAKLIVPRQQRREMLDSIHKSHLGIYECEERAGDISSLATHVFTPRGNGISVCRL